MREPQTLRPLSYSLSGAAACTSFSLSTIDAAVRAGTLPVRRHGNRVVILSCDLERWLESLPSGRPDAPPQLEGKRTGRPRRFVLKTLKGD